MSLDQLMREVVAGEDEPVAVEATVLRDVEVVGDELSLRIPSFDRQHLFKGTGWSPLPVGNPPDALLPKEGDRALVVPSDEGEAWVVSWLPAEQSQAAPIVPGEAIRRTEDDTGWEGFDPELTMLGVTLGGVLTGNLPNPGIADLVITAEMIASVNASAIIGTITADQIGSVNASSITGLISADQIGSVNASAITGTISAGQIGTITAGQITGTINSTQINTINATQITGSITAGQIGTITAGQITGTITAGQIGTINAGQIIGSITAGQIASVSAGTIVGTVTATQIGSVNAGVITGGITATQVTSINAGAIGGTGTIGAAYLNVATLSALTANMGTLTAGTLRIGVAGGTKVAIGDSISTSAGTKSGIVGTDSSNAITFWMDSATGNLQLKGTVLAGSSGLGNISGTINGSTNITPLTIPGGNLIVGTITTSQIATDTIAATNIAASAIGVSELAAASVSTAKLQAEAVTSATIIASEWIEAKKFRTGPAGQRIEFDPTSLRKYDASGNATVTLAAADGLDLLAGVSTTPPNDRQIRWMTGATAVGRLDAYSDGGLDAMRMFSRRTANDRTSAVQLLALDENGSPGAYLEVAERYDEYKYIAGSINAQSVTVFDSDYKSSFLHYGQPGGQVQLRKDAPGCRATHSAAQALTAGQHNWLTFNTDRKLSSDGTAIHDYATNNTRFKAPIAGWYSYGVMVTYTNGTLYARKNGTTIIHDVYDNYGYNQSIHGICYLNLGDYLEFSAWPATNVSTQKLGEISPEAWLMWHGP